MTTTSCIQPKHLLIRVQPTFGINATDAEKAGRQNVVNTLVRGDLLGNLHGMRMTANPIKIDGYRVFMPMRTVINGEVARDGERREWVIIVGCFNVSELERVVWGIFEKFIGPRTISAAVHRNLPLTITPGSIVRVVTRPLLLGEGYGSVGKLFLE